MTVTLLWRTAELSRNIRRENSAASRDETEWALVPTLPHSFGLLPRTQQHAAEPHRTVPARNNSPVTCHADVFPIRYRTDL